MRNTPQYFKRQEINQIIHKVLKEDVIRLSPVSISVAESLDNDFTTTDFSFELNCEGSKIIALERQMGKGFVDGLFTGLMKYFSKDYNSLKNIKLADYNVNPMIFNSKNSMGTDAQASVSLSVRVEAHGLSEFQHTSRSMIYSSFVSSLEAFQFYVNCDRCFHKIQMFLESATSRNRGDLASECIYDLSRLTEVNTYERKESN